MANQNTIADLSVTPASNLNFLGQNIRGTALANTIDTMFQNLAAMLATQYDELGGTGTVGGTANAITLTTSASYPFSALADGMLVAFKATADNTGATTIDVDSLGAKAIRLQGDTACSGGEIKNKGTYLLKYDSAYNSSAGAWVLLNSGTSIALPVSVANGGTGLSSYTSGDLPYASGSTTISKLGIGTNGQSLVVSSGAPAWGSSIVLGTTTATTSGTSVSFSSIPSWVRQVVILFNGVSTNGTSSLRVRIGPSGGVETSGYNVVSTTQVTTSINSQAPTTGIDLDDGTASAAVRHGTITLTLEDASNNVWAIAGQLSQSDAQRFMQVAGTKALAGPLSIITITTVNGTDTFDAGSVNIAYH
jgi:hypothetical protein